MRQIIQLFFSFCLVFSFSISAFAATVTWDGDAADGLWTSPTNWDGDILPGSSDDVVINNGDDVSLTSATAQTVKSILIDLSSTLTVGSSATLNVTGSTADAITANTLCSLTNSGTVSVSNSGAHGLQLNKVLGGGSGGQLVNNSGASLTISGAAGNGINIATSTAGMTNDGTITISGSTGDAIFKSGVLTNNNLLQIAGNLNGVTALTGTLAPGTSLGITTTTGNFDISGGTLEIEVDDKTTAGTDFDQLQINGDANVGGDLDVTFDGGYTPVDADRIVIVTYTGTLSGDFTANPALPAGWAIDDATFGQIALVYTEPCGGGGTAGLWVGCNGDGEWTTAANWDNGAVPTATVDVVIDIDETVTVSGAAFARSITTSNGGDLTVNSSIALTVSTVANPSTGDGINLGDGSVLINNGTIDISDTGDYGIRNFGTVTNNGSGNINITNTTDCGFSCEGTGDIFDNSGILTVTGSSSINLIINLGAEGNNNGGTISVSNNTSGSGINISGTLVNSGDITITNAATFGLNMGTGGIVTNNSPGTIHIDGTGDDGFRNQKTVTNNAGATITIDDAGDYGFRNDAGNDVLDNFGTINIDNSTDNSISNLGTITNKSTGVFTITNSNSRGIGNSNIFNNDSGGSITVTGSTNAGIHNKPGDNLTNAGIIIINSSTNEDELWNDGGTLTNTGGIIKVNGSMLGVSALAGTLAPGNSVGTTDTDGNLTLTGTLEIEADDRTTIDVLNSTNSGTLDLTGATLQFVFAGIADDYLNGDKFQIFTGFATVTAVGTITNNLGFTIVDNGNGEFEITDGALPVELLSFTARAEKSKVILDWQTASEINNEGFEIEHSRSGFDWGIVGFVEGNGNSVEVQNYGFIHTAPTAGVNYYRLKQIDFDGVFEYSKTVSIQVEGDDDLLSLFPNPIGRNGSLNIRTNTETSGTIALFNSFGKQIRSIDFDEETTGLEISLLDLPAGVFIIRLESGRRSVAKRLIIE